MPAKSDAVCLGLLGMRIIIGITFLLAGLSKVQSPGAFAAAVRAYHLLPSPLVVPFALVLPWLELLLAAYLLVGFLTRVGAVGVSGMLVMFIIALADALLTGNTAHACGCFGGVTNPVISLLAGGSTIGWWDVVRDLILLVFALLLVWRGPGIMSVDDLVVRRGRGTDADETLEEV